MSSPPFENILVAERGSVLHVTFNRPELKNALGPEMVGELLKVVDRLEQDRAIAAVVLRGAGGTFSSGGNIKGFMDSFSTPKPAGDVKDPIAVNNRRFGAFLSRFDALPQTVVVAVEGAAFGGGVGLACVGDVTLVTADARFAMTETSLGVPPAQIAPFVAARVGVPQARRLALTGHRFDGREAVRIGLAHILCETSADLDAALAKVIEQIGRCAPGASAATKRIILDTLTVPRETVLDRASDAFATCLRSDEGREGVSAFLEKRAPRWAEDAKSTG